MTSLVALWLPILLSAIVVFVVSSIIHMAPLWHRNDYPRVPDEDRFRAAVGPLAIPPGDYLVPRAASGSEMRGPDYIRKLEDGPVLLMTVLPNGPSRMGKSLVLWFVYSLVVGLFAAYVASRALSPGAEYMEVFRFVGTTAFIGYALALWQTTIWYKRAWSATLKANFDGLIYALSTAGVFGWLWPA